MPLEVKLLGLFMTFTTSFHIEKMQVLLFGFRAKAQKRMGLHTGGLFIRAVLFDPRYFPSYAISCLYREYKAWCERQGRILAGPGPGPGVSILSSVCHFIYHPSLEDLVRTLQFPVTQTDSMFAMVKCLLVIILSLNQEIMIKPLHFGIFFSPEHWFINLERVTEKLVW